MREVGTGDNPIEEFKSLNRRQYKRDSLLRGNRGGEIIEITIKGSDGKKIQTLRTTGTDKDRIKYIVHLLKNKYNVDFTAEKALRSDQDLDWLNLDF